ncbi:HAD hydrolase-like protein [Candidatus Woesearchaeota archaeon]|nr:HAD hydrolase-like protein [Candidatus Woesearchaeota archaeon]
MIKLIVFDLDDTLFDNSSTLSIQGNVLAAKAMAKAGLPAPWKEVYNKRLTLAAQLDPHFSVINKALCESYGIADPEKVAHICKAAEDGYNSVDVKNIALFPGVRDMLSRLKTKYTLVLLSTGPEELQQKKIAKLDIRDFFDFICIADGKTITKSSCLRQVLEMYHYHPSQICVVGDRIDSEIRYANELGMVTVQLVHGKYSTLKPKDELEKAKYQVKQITAVERLMQEIK